jgi:hypothetical protein
MLQFLLPAMGLAGSMVGGAASLAGGALSLGGGLLHAGSTAIGLGAKGIGAIGKAAGGLMPSGGQDREIQGGQPHQVGDVNGKYQDRTGRWHDRNKNNQFTTAPAQLGANGFAGGSGLAAGGSAAGGGGQMEMDFGGTGGMNEPGEVGPFGMLIGLLGGMANDISAIKGLTSGILNSMIADESEDDQQDAQMDLFQEQQLAEQQEAQRQAQDLIDKGKREGSLTDTDGDSKKGTSLLGKAFGPIKSGWNKILNQPNWLKALGLGGLLWWLSQNKEGFVKGLTVVLEWVQDLVKKFRSGDWEMPSLKTFAVSLAEGIGTLFDKIKESELFKTLWPPMRDLIHDFAAAVFKMGKEILNEFLPWKQSFGKSSRAIAGRTGEAQGFKSTLGGIQESMGADLTEESFKGLAKDDPRKERIEVAKEALYDEMRMISRESKRRVQWKGITGTHSLLGGRDSLSGLPIITPSLEALLRTVPIIDGDEATWGQLADIDLSLGIPADATKGQIRDIEKLLEKKSELQAKTFVTEATKVVGEPGGPRFAIKGRMDTADERAARVAKLQAEKAAIDEELKVLNVSYGKTEVKTDAATGLTDGTTAAVTDEFAGGGGFTFVDGKLVRVSRQKSKDPDEFLGGMYPDVLPKLPNITSLREGVEKDWVNRSQGWDPNFLFKGTLADWIRVRANTIQMGPWDKTDEGKAHWEHQIRVDNMKIIGLSGRDDAHKMANLADPIGYALADLAKGNALNEFVHGTTIGGGAVPVPLANVGANVRTLQGLTTAQLQHIRGDSGTGGGNVLVSTGAKTNINSNTVNTANIAAKDKEWTQTILNSPRFNMYNFAQ